ncbi:SRPBCC family protein [Pseudoalteromonas spongiae]|uniref:SRPBCC family protein n=1 Tax=Pseudoalteromonas spongiae TaxID=298657 RepID=UPI003735C92A
MEINVSTEINCAKEQVWKAITDIGNCKNMIDAIIDLTVLERPETGLVGLKWTETREMFGKEASETMWITEAVEGQYYCTRAENCGAVYLTKMAVAEDNGKTVLMMSFSSESMSFIGKVFSALMGLLMKKSLVKMLEKDLQDIKQYLENK